MAQDCSGKQNKVSIVFWESSPFGEVGRLATTLMAYRLLPNSGLPGIARLSKAKLKLLSRIAR